MWIALCALALGYSKAIYPEIDAKLVEANDGRKVMKLFV
jgi:hypothetical protein